MGPNTVWFWRAISSMYRKETARKIPRCLQTLSSNSTCRNSPQRPWLILNQNQIKHLYVIIRFNISGKFYRRLNIPTTPIELDHVSKIRATRHAQMNQKQTLPSISVLWILSIVDLVTIHIQLFHVPPSISVFFCLIFKIANDKSKINLTESIFFYFFKRGSTSCR